MNKLIVYKDWEKLTLDIGGELWETGAPLPTKPYVFTTCDHADLLFRSLLESYSTHRFVLISAASDFGPDHNNKQPWEDIRRWVNMDPNLDKQLDYHDYMVRMRCEKTRCLKRDKFAMKAYCWTSSTYPCLPNNIIRWFVTNCQVEDERITPIPFGIGIESESLIEEYLAREIKPDVNANKDPKIVASWTHTTNERYALHNSLKQYEEFLTDKCEPIEFMERLSKSMFCVCPEGNGLDCYRILEALYMGCIPVVLCNGSISWTKAYSKIVDKLLICRTNDLITCINEISQEPINITEYLYLDAWKRLIKEAFHVAG